MVVRPGTGAVWADSPVTSAPYVIAGQDTVVAASSFTTTLGAFPNAPVDGDIIIAFGATPTDSTLHTPDTGTITATGLSGGTVVSGTGRTTTGNDMSTFKAAWYNFTGTGSSGVTVNFILTAGSNSSGPIFAIHLRQDPLVASYSDSLGLTDSASGVMNRAVNQADNMGLTDSAQALLGTEALDQNALDNIGLTDVATVTTAKSLAPVDNLGLTDSAVAQIFKLGEQKVNPFVLGGVEGQFTLDFIDFGIDVGETVPSGVTKTIWAKYVTSDMTEAAIQFTSPNTDLTMTVYDDDGLTQLYQQDDANPINLFIDTDDEGQVFYIQFGVRAGDDEDAVLTWGDGTPPTYSDPSTPAVIDGDYGRDEVVLTPSSESWVSWVAPDSTTVIYTVTGEPSSQSYTVTIYEGDTSTVIDTVTGSGVQTVEIPVTAGETYWLKFTSASGGMSFHFTYNVLPSIVSPADEYKTFIVEVYKPDGVTLITEVPRRKGLTFQEPLNEVGSGSLTISLSDPLLEVYPTLFDWKNIVKVWMGNKCVHGFKIKRKRTTLVGSGEVAERLRTVSGPSVMNLLDDFIVRHDGLMTDKSLDVRNFGWMAMNGEWHDPSVWNGPYNVSPQSDPPSDLNQPPEDRAKWHQPDQWPDPTSDWIWISHNPDKNEGNFNPPPLKGKRYFRKSFEVANGSVNARLYATADEVYRIYLDGELVLEGDGKETGYTEMQKVKLKLRQGTHTIAVFSRSRGQSSGTDAADAFMMSLMKINTKGKPTSVILNSGEGWNTSYQRPVPTWNKAYVMRAVVREAKDRGVTSANMLTFDFTGEVDSHGNAWTDRYSEEIGIGTSGLGVQALLSEAGGFDVWVDPEDFKLKAWRRRGTDKSASITLEPGRNLTAWEVEEVDEVKNDFLLQYDGGWTRYVAHGSKDTYGEREAFVTLGYAKDDEDAERIIKKASDGIAWAVDRAGTGDIVKRKEIDTAGGMIAVQGARPFLDFVPGDTVKAPNKQGILKPHRVLMITATEDDDGRVSYDPECEEVR